ncbi:MAG: hypothetical protein WDO06_00250 [Actinomycetota bacterium]
MRKKFVSTAGFMPLGTRDEKLLFESMDIADLWLNDATVFSCKIQMREKFSVDPIG